MRIHTSDLIFEDSTDPKKFKFGNVFCITFAGYCNAYIASGVVVSNSPSEKILTIHEHLMNIKGFNAQCISILESHQFTRVGGHGNVHVFLNMSLYHQ
jgi:hypothetical protein